MKEKAIIAVCVVVVAYGGWRLFSSDLVLGGGTTLAGRRMLDVETNYKFTIEIGPDFAGWPVKSPKTGKMTGFPAEACYFNACGKKQGGTWVVLKETMGQDGGTSCPECGQRVVGHNPLPQDTYVDKQGHLQRSNGPADAAADGRGGR